MNGDILVGMDGDFNVAWWKGGYALLNQRVCCLRSQTNKFLQRLLYYHLPCPLKQINDVTYSTTVKHLSSSDIKKIRIPVPPLHEQHAIVVFLDSQTSKLDALIAKKCELIAKLQEKRAALITRTVTRGLPPEAAKAAGLDPHPKMKDSGLEWLGEMPEHWEVKRLDSLADRYRPIMYGIVLPGPDFEGGVPIIKGGDVRPQRLNPDTLSKTSPEIDEKHARSRITTGDILYSIRGSFGEAELVPKSLDNANLTQDVARISKTNNTNTVWLLQFLKSEPIRQQVTERSVGATIRGVNIKDLKRVFLAVPPFEEQHAIANYLERENAKLNQMTSKVKTAIERLQEYRSALIAAAVTGKIDVRNIPPEAA